MGVQVGRLGHLRFCLGCVFYRNPRWIPAFFSFFSLHKSDIAPSSPCRIFDFSYSFYSFPFFDLVMSLSFFEVTTYDLVHVGFSVYHNTYIHTSLHLYLSPLSLSSLHLFFPHFKKLDLVFVLRGMFRLHLTFIFLPFCFILKIEKTCYDYDDMDRIPAFLLPLLTSPLFISRFNSKFPRLFSSIMSLSPSYSSPPPTHLTSHESTYHTPGTTHGFLSPFFSFSLHIYLRPHLQFLHCSLFPPSPPPSLFSIHHYRITTNSLLGTTTTLHTIEFIILFPT